MYVIKPRVPFVLGFKIVIIQTQKEKSYEVIM